jgi:hypothetical protein
MEICIIQFPLGAVGTVYQYHTINNAGGYLCILIVTGISEDPIPTAICTYVPEEDQSTRKEIVERLIDDCLESFSSLVTISWAVP